MMDHLQNLIFLSSPKGTLFKWNFALGCLTNAGLGMELMSLAKLEPASGEFNWDIDFSWCAGGYCRQRKKKGKKSQNRD